MQITYTPEQEQLRQELRAYYDRAAHARGGASSSPTARASAPTCGASCARWVPTAGSASAGRRSTAARGVTPIEQFIFFDESMRAGAPVPMLTINTVGPTIMHFGTEEQKDFFLPKILKGEIHFCIGYSEPGAGTDLAALRTKAVRDGDEYVINGQKMWTSLGQRRRLLLARRPHRTRRPRSTRASRSSSCRWTRPGINVEPIHLLSEHNISAGVLRRRARAGRQPGRRGEQRLVAHHQPAQPRAGHAVLARASSSARSTRCVAGRRTPSCPTAAG